MCAVVPVLIAGSMDLVYIGDRQAGSMLNWYIFHDPFTFITFWVYFTCATASVNRAPFDLAEAESELVAGFHTEYSGLRWSFFFMAEYGSMMAVSLLATILFLGGWNGPLPVTSWLGLTFESGPLWGHLGNVLGVVNLLGKGVLGVVVMMWIRWTLPRLRIDQVITVCLKYCVPIAAVMFLGATWWQYMWPDGLILKMPRSAYELREHWPQEASADPPANVPNDSPTETADRTTDFEAYRIAGRETR
jgi:NADH-quinone oxidoreductase subunit H